MRITKSKLSEIGLLLIFKALLEVVYVLFVNPVYEYSGFILEINTVKLLESYVFVLFLYFFLPTGEHRISAIATKLLFVFMVVPTLSFYALANESRAFLYFSVTGFWLTLLIIQIFPNIQIKRPKGLTSTLLLSIGMFSIGVYAILIKINGLPTLKALDLSKVYEIRSVVTWGPPFMGYLVMWQANVINPFLLSIAWYKRKYFSLLVILGFQFFLYLITARKGFLFNPLLLWFVIYAIYKRNLLKASLWGLIGTVSASFAIYALGWGTILASLFIRRLLFAPAQILFNYYDFFSKHQLVYLSASHLNPFLNNPYNNISIPHLIGMIYYNKPAMWVCTGYLGDAYMNFGFLGVLLFSALLGIIFVILDSITARTNIAIAVGALIIPIDTLVSGGLFTVLGTEGLLVGMFIVWLYHTKSSGKQTTTVKEHVCA